MECVCTSVSERVWTRGVYRVGPSVCERVPLSVSENEHGRAFADQDELKDVCHQRESNCVCGLVRVPRECACACEWASVWHCGPGRGARQAAPGCAPSSPGEASALRLPPEDWPSPQVSLLTP